MNLPFPTPLTFFFSILRHGSCSMGCRQGDESALKVVKAGRNDGDNETRAGVTGLLSLMMDVSIRAI